MLPSPIIVVLLEEPEELDTRRLLRLIYAIEPPMIAAIIAISEDAIPKVPFKKSSIYN